MKLIIRGRGMPTKKTLDKERKLPIRLFHFSTAFSATNSIATQTSLDTKLTTSLVIFIEEVE